MCLWIQKDGNTFLAETNSIGSNIADAKEILGRFDEFEAQTAVSRCSLYCNIIIRAPPLFVQKIYNTCTQLLSWAQQMEESGSCWLDLLHQESHKLEGTIQDFVSRLDQCRETITVAIDYHTLAEKVKTSLFTR